DLFAVQVGGIHVELRKLVLRVHALRSPHFAARPPDGGDGLTLRPLRIDCDGGCKPETTRTPTRVAGHRRPAPDRRGRPRSGPAGVEVLPTPGRRPPTVAADAAGASRATRPRPRRPRPVPSAARSGS